MQKTAASREPGEADEDPETVDFLEKMKKEAQERRVRNLISKLPSKTTNSMIERLARRAHREAKAMEEGRPIPTSSISVSRKEASSRSAPKNGAAIPKGVSKATSCKTPAMSTVKSAAGDGKLHVKTGKSGTGK